jgi:endo-1,3(4)-beta-glucanase
MDSIDASLLHVTNMTYSSIKGTMTAVIGSSWSLKEHLTPIKWFSPSGIPITKRADIQAALQQEKGRRNYVGDPYTAGKVLASMARLALIADELGDNQTASSIRQNLKDDLDPWLLGTNWNALRYESAWGGLCSSLGLTDMNADYGQGWYNDHHFHYGYMIYAAAVIGKEDKVWINQRRSALMDIVRDYANPSSQDPHFPVTRNKDWFDGHSWASGLFPFGDSKNQESTSESVNAYYGVYLLGESLGDSQLRDWGRMLLATEIRSVHKYWQITSDSQIYGAPFKDNKIVGVLWSTKVDYATFFGGNIEYIHCIQMMPFTPITEQLLPAAWVEEEYPVLSTVFTRNETISEAWKGYVYMDHAIIDKETAWTEVKSLQWYDNGNSKTNALYWVASRPSNTKKRMNLN